MCEARAALAIAEEAVRGDCATPAEVEAVRAEVDGLRSAASDMLAGWRYIRRVHGDLPGVGWDRAENAVRSALTPPEVKAP